jgi:tetratricopeptide (TPR) repeat protein
MIHNRLSTAIAIGLNSSVFKDHHTRLVPILALTFSVLACAIVRAEDGNARVTKAAIKTTPSSAQAVQTNAGSAPRQMNFQELRYNLSGPNRAHSLKELDDSVKQHPQSPAGYLHRGQAYLEDGDSENALKNFHKALAVDPRFAPAHIGISRVMQGLGNYPAAFTELRKAAELGDNDVATGALWESAFLHRELKQMDIALDEYTTVLKKGLVGKSRQALAIFQRGETYLRINQLDKALSDLNAAINLDSNVLLFHVMRAEAYLALNKPNQALTDLNVAIETSRKTTLSAFTHGVSNRMVSLYRKRAAIYQKLGKKELAERDLKLAKDDEAEILNIAPFRTAP